MQYHIVKIVTVTLDLPKDVNKKVEHFKIEHELKDKRDVIIALLKQSTEKNISEEKSIEEIYIR